MNAQGVQRFRVASVDELPEGRVKSVTAGSAQYAAPWHGWDFDPLTGKPPGGHGPRVTAAHELDAAFATARAVKGPSLVEIVTDPELV